MRTPKRIGRGIKTRIGQPTTQTFNAPGTFQPKYGRGKFTVAGAGGAGSTNAPVPGNTNPPTPGQYYYQADAEYNTFGNYNSPCPTPYSSTNGQGFTANSNFVCSPGQITRLVSFTGLSPTMPSPSSSANFAVAYSEIANYSTPGNTNPSTPGSTNTGPAINLFGVTLPGGYGGPATPVGDTPATVPFSNSAYNISVPSGGFVTIKSSE